MATAITVTYQALSASPQLVDELLAFGPGSFGLALFQVARLRLATASLTYQWSSRSRCRKTAGDWITTDATHSVICNNGSISPILSLAIDLFGKNNIIHILKRSVVSSDY